ncbi:MAG: DNA translocase FtsK 4TM domain-containing protein [Alphaproteobacteria bacterium]|jgi:S-DNA-T family DNA segregation ATPase FtsK/SpoIIIE|nr:DNA translocase FtsK 4TM domain-containing protein [Alphaproteobacteria bacterium]MDP6516064.1 DNA translocase FtsK 4TM domain-containing protein [Alphaproteobacteria bacterium]
MASQSNSARGGAVLPRIVAESLRRRAIESAGLALIAAAVVIVGAIATYTPTDPSLNNATNGPAQNLFGRPGAYIGDALIQFFGLCGALPGLALGGWGWRLIRRHRIDLAWLRLALLPFVMLAGAGAIEVLDAPAGWPAEGGLGGLVGAFLLGHEHRLASSLAAPTWAVATLLGVLSAAVLPLILGVPWNDWRAVGNGLWRGTVWAVATLASAFRSGPDPVARARSKPRDGGAGRPANRTEPRLEHGPRAAELVQASAARAGKREAAERQGRLALDSEAGLLLPPLDLLAAEPAKGKAQSLDDDALAQNARLLESVLEDFSVHGQIARVRQGPVVTRYELEPAPGTRSARVISLADDIARSMSAISARVAVVPGQNAIGIELPNAVRETVYLRGLLATEDYERSTNQLALALGKDISGAPVIVDLARMPHLLVAGTTGSGKSVAVNSMILSLLYRLRPDQCRFIMIDPKMLELSVYDGIPHLLHPVVTDPKKAVVALKWAVREMNQRYRLMSGLNVRNIAGYNRRLDEARAKDEVLTRTVQTGFDTETGKPIYEEQALDMEPLPLLVLVVDEMADLMLVAGKDIEVAIQSLAQRARASGIHLIIATQRPSVDVITGTIKANLPTRISFQVTSKIDSRTILGEQGAEQLLGMGDMLHMAGGSQVSRVHGPYVSEDEVEKVANFLRAQAAPEYLEAITEDEDDDEAAAPGRGSGDELYDRALDLVAREGKASTSFIQRHLQIGYNRAARLIERLEAEGVVSQANHVGKREVLVRKPGEDY